MNKIRPLVLAALLASSTSFAAPFMAIGDGAELFVTGVLGVRADDNITLSSNGEDDLIFDITPGAELTFGKDAQLQGAVTIAHAWSSYSDNSRFNTNLFSGDVVTRYDDGKMKLGFNFGYHELNQNTAEVRGLIRRNVTSAAGNGEVEISQLTSVGAGVSFEHQDYRDRPGYTDSDTFTVPVDLFYKWTEKVDVSVGYRFREYRADTVGDDSDDHFFNVGARGAFTPKLTGKIAVGLTNRDIDRGGDESMVGLDASLAYEVSPKTNLQVGASHDFGTTPQGQQQKNFTFNTSLSTKLTEQWSANGGISYRSIDYKTRTDDYFEGTLGASYIFSSSVRFVGAYVFRNYSSDIGSAEFSNNVFSIAANFRY